MDKKFLKECLFNPYAHEFAVEEAYVKKYDEKMLKRDLISAYAREYSVKEFNREDRIFGIEGFLIHDDKGNLDIDMDEFRDFCDLIGGVCEDEFGFNHFVYGVGYRVSRDFLLDRFNEYGVMITW